ncbi:MAG: hypothetical protein HFI94_11255 [Lachnospiraceae bacterium]|jgi:flagellar capping protein FliD|nr:hypothetical protein [Lachnospiraceae bacterium]
MNLWNSGFLFNGGASSSSNGIYSLLSEYNNIRSGAYYKVVKAYYAKQSGTDTKTDTKNSTGTTSKKTEAEQAYSGVQSSAKALISSADKLIATGKNSLFELKDIETKDENGQEITKKGYDTDAIYNAVKGFVDNYNTLMSAASSSGSSTIQNQATSMANNTKAYEKLLSKVGITIGANHKLSIDQATFKAADMTTVKTLFNGNASFAYSASSKASLISFSANSEANKKSMYTNNGTYNNAYSSGSFMNSIF